MASTFSNSTVPVVNRLLADADKRTRKLEDARKQKAELEAHEFSFKPQLISKRIVTKCEEPKKKQVVVDKPSFAPKLATASYVHKPSSDNSANVHERLFDKGIKAIRDVEEKVRLFQNCIHFY